MLLVWNYRNARFASKNLCLSVIDNYFAQTSAKARNGGLGMLWF
jgi:hypothetical protein